MYQASAVEDTLKMLLVAGVSARAQNYLGQTPLHLACGSTAGGTFETILRSEIGQSINTPDNNGIYPIHLAATFSEKIVAKLIERGADPNVVTNEGSNLLHIAARSRESNTIGLILETVQNKQHSIDSKDDRGRTPLHYACRSGRIESVSVLLKAGADITMLDKNNFTPLHTCAEFEEEDFLWSTAARKMIPYGKMHAAGVLIDDSLRPKDPQQSRFNNTAISMRPAWAYISSDNQTTAIRSIVQLLLEHGAERTALYPISSPMDIALSKGCGEMLDSLLSFKKRSPSDGQIANKPLGIAKAPPFQVRHLIKSSKVAIIQDDIDLDRSGYLCGTLLGLRDFDAIRKLPNMGVTFHPNHERVGGDFMTTLAHWGYTSLFESLGDTIQGPWINGLPEALNENGWRTSLPIEPYLITATRRSLPNLDTIKIIVEKFSADVNVQLEVRQGYGETAKNVPGSSPLHILAEGTHWWQNEAIAYLLDHGANPELKNESGETVLHVAVRNDHPRYRSKVIVETLLQHGADPNSLDNAGLTCLNKAMHDLETVRLLLKSGVDRPIGKEPPLFSAIRVQNVAAVMELLNAGADPNRGMLIKSQLPTLSISEDFPLHYATSHEFNTPKKQANAIDIADLLLRHGANPYQEYRKNEIRTTILHDIILTGGILQPFLELPDLDREICDQHGRTLLLTACTITHRTYKPANHSDDFSMSWERRVKELQELRKGDPSRGVTMIKTGANVLAKDNEGNNALHLMCQLAPSDSEDENLDLLHLLIEGSSELVRQKNSTGYTPFHYAIASRNMSRVEILLEAGADLESDPKGNTPLHHLSPVVCNEKMLRPWLAWFEKFVQMGISVNAKNNEGASPLFNHYSELHPQHNGCVFEDAGADFSLMNNKGETLLHVIAGSDTRSDYMNPYDKHSIEVIFKFLMSKGLDIMREDKSQKTALVSLSLSY